MMQYDNAGRTALMNKIAALDLSVHESVLFLDTHPNCREAMQYFCDQLNMLRECTRVYEEKYGPLKAHSTNVADGWSWIKSPWPWQTQNTRMC